ncbi:MAG: hypothetical protein J6C13_00105 [Clostridia bacterium]|nr:hypothetical protein [Clostridia bacterium]
MIETRGLQKLKQVLINDKHFNPTRFNELLTSDIFRVLQNYMEISKDELLSRIDIDAEGNYVFKCKVKCRRLKIVGLLNN